MAASPRLVVLELENNVSAPSVVPEPPNMNRAHLRARKADTR